MEIFTRLLLALALCLLGLGLYWAWNRWQLQRLSRARTEAPGLEGLRPGVPALLYFTTPDCAPCRTTQRPALERLKTELGEGLQVLEVDASLRPSVADYWGVLSVPTTFVIDAAGQPRRVNHGVASKEKLKQQLEEVGEGPSNQGQRAKQPRAGAADNQTVSVNG
jgi:thioredoxin 1